MAADVVDPGPCSGKRSIQCKQRYKSKFVTNTFNTALDLLPDPSLDLDTLQYGHTCSLPGVGVL